VWAGKPPKTKTWTVCKAPGDCDFDTIQAAIDAAADGDEVVVEPGAYHERINFSGWSAGAPKAIVVRSTDPQNEAVRNATIIDWTEDYVGQAESGDVVYFNSGEDSSSVLEGFTIQGGGSSYGPPGSGISCVNSSPTIRYCTIQDNTPTTNNGGGIRLNSCSATIRNCLIRNNTVSSHSGGGISIDNNSDAMIEDCIISGNLATGAGGINIADSSPRIVNCTIENNETGGSGGGIYVTGYASGNAAPVIENCTITGNSAHGGGALYSYMASPHVTGTAITGNWTVGATSFGGAIYSYNSDMSLSGSTISGNFSRTGGGGIVVQGGGLLTVDRTDTLDGGAIYFRGQTSFAQIMNSTIADNGGGLRGGLSMALDADSPATVDITNSILYYNSGSQIYVNTISPDPNVNYSDIQDCWTVGTMNICSDPLFTSDSCGKTGYALAQGSPGIDEGTDVNAPADDLCLVAIRPADGGGGAATDMGAYESVAQVCTITIAAANYDYVNDTLVVEATSPYGASADLDLVGYGPMVKQGPQWAITVNGLSPAPDSVSVYGPLDGCTATD
jgi:parallel beta-helix repeat protein